MEDRYRTFWARATAGFVDVLVFIPLRIANKYVDVPQRDHVSLIFWLIFSTSVVFMYSVVMHAVFGQTIGKMAAHVKVFDVSEQRIPSLWQAALRDVGDIVVGIAWLGYLVYLVSVNQYFPGHGIYSLFSRVVNDAWLVWFVLELATMFTNNKRRAFHDYIAGTVVVDEW
jgi:uncharacterized RDD family membrane protein YckC